MIWRASYWMIESNSNFLGVLNLAKLFDDTMIVSSLFEMYFMQNLKN